MRGAITVAVCFCWTNGLAERGTTCSVLTRIPITIMPSFIAMSVPLISEGLVSAMYIGAACMACDRSQAGGSSRKGEEGDREKEGEKGERG